MFLWALNTPVYLIWLTYQKICVSTKKMVAGVAHKKYFKKQHIVKIRIAWTEKQKAYFPNTAYLSNQIW